MSALSDLRDQILEGEKKAAREAMRKLESEQDAPEQGNAPTE